MVSKDVISGLRGPSSITPELNKLRKPGADVGGPSFKETLEGLKQNIGKADGAVKSEPLKFSNHAIERMKLRGLSFSPDQLQKIETAVDKARAKGANNTLVLNDQSAMIVSVKNNTVVTIMDRASMKENVFTNIDSTVFA